MSSATLSPTAAGAFDAEDAASFLPKLKTFSQAARKVPSARGKGTSGSTLFRWFQQGRLRAVFVGGRWMTTDDWVVEMIERESAARAGAGAVASTSQRSKSAGDRAADRSAEEVGYKIEK